MRNRRFVITVDRSKLDSDPSDPYVIRVEDTQTGRVTHAREAFMGPAVIKHGPPRMDGARVWVETDSVFHELP